MGSGIITFFRDKCKKSWKIAFIATIIIGLCAHIYKFTNMLPNHDSILNFYTDQNMTMSGRWFLQIACIISSYFDLPWICGLFSIIFIAFTVIVITEFFKLENPVLIILVSGIMVTFPAVTETFFFEYTADGYMLAMLMAAVSAYITRIGEKRISRYIISSVLICLSLGIYQAYLSFAMILLAVHMMTELFENKRPLKEYLCWIGKQVAVYAAAVASYYIVWKLCMRIQGITPTEYLGIDSVGESGISNLIFGIKNSVKYILKFFINWDVSEYGFTVYNMLSIIFIILFTYAFVSAVIKSKIWKNKSSSLLLMICLIATVPIICIWFFTSPDISYGLRMTQSLSLLYIFTLILFEKWVKFSLRDIIIPIFMIIIINNTVMANISYLYLNKCLEKTYADGIEMSIRIHEFEENNSIDKIAVIGSKYSDNSYSKKDNSEFFISQNIFLLKSTIQKSLLYDFEHTYNYLKNTFDFNFKPLSKDETEQLQNTEAAKEMGVWPASDSVTVIDKTLIIKLSEKKD